MKAQEAAEAAAKAVVPPKPDELKVTSRLRLSSQQLAQTFGFMQSRGLSEGAAVMALGHATEDDVIAAEAELTASRWVSSDQLAEHKAEAKAALSEELCTAMQVLPISVEGAVLTVAMRDPLDAGALQTVSEHAKGLKVVAVRAGTNALKVAIEKAFENIVDDDPSTWLER